MRKGKMLFIMLQAVIFTCHLHAQAPQTLFDNANALYTEQKFEEAKTAYEEIVKSGSTSSKVYFNLGNAFFKTGNYPAAILNYERALKLDPADKDIQFNLRFANQNIIDRIDSSPLIFYERWWQNLTGSKSSVSLYILISMWTAFFSGILYLFINKLFFKKITFFSAAAFFLSGMFLLLIISLQQKENNIQEAIIFSADTYVRSSPGESSTGLFVLHAGTKVYITDELKGWKRIRIANGNEGWIEQSSLEII